MLATATRSTWHVDVTRSEWITSRSFDEVLERLHAGLGRPDFTEFVTRINTIQGWDAYRRELMPEAGSSGLIQFLELDLGAVVPRDPDAGPYRSVRIIAGNPAAMESLTRTSPAVGAFAPITILLFEAADGVHIRYDTVASEAGAELSDAAMSAAARLDHAVVTLIVTAAQFGRPRAG
ncbi:DUF302 domain-containing protein [Herbiconiux sp. CPCC 205763]|uniref:DUF302 domain-containing protein n=1 Tax=Herbiconiux aconitum TaxID=2970913 RepID=A0ABT2GT63_9MICO|nr:DUF302 domain-containing protein [Herbiconiux aconitum]MCS5719380.1 DUF302 domain-containing protein [Herbiconiux aconitum]